MKYRQAGPWQVSAIGYGCYGLSGAYGGVDAAAYERVILRAIELGVNFFDTAEGYGEAEAILGKVVAPFRDQIIIATKVSGEAGQPDLSAAALRKACEASLKRLNTEVIDLYQVHFDDPHTPVLETVAGLESLVEVGKIRRYGVGHLPIDRVAAYAEAGSLFSVLMELSPVARGAAQALLPLCAERDVAAIAFSVTGRGILSGQYAPNHVFEAGDIRRMDPLFQRERYQSATRVRDYLAELGAAYGCSAVQMGIAWVLAQPGVACALTGTSSLDHLDESLAANQISLDQADLDALESFLDGEDACLAEAQTAEVQRLLHEPLAEAPAQAFIDLVYVMETAVTLGAARQDAVMPAFMELFALRGALDVDAQRKMRAIQQVLREMLVGDEPKPNPE